MAHRRWRWQCHDTLHVPGSLVTVERRLFSGSTRPAELWLRSQGDRARYRATARYVGHRIRARFMVPAGPTIRFLEQVPRRALRRRFGYQDIEVGSPRLDDRVIIQGHEEAAVRAVLAAGADLLAPHVDWVARFESDGRRMVLETHLVPVERRVAVPLRDLRDAVGRMAAVDLWGIGRVAELPTAQLSWPEGGGPPMATVTEPLRARIYVSEHDHAPATRVWSAAGLLQGPIDEVVAPDGDAPVFRSRGLGRRPALAGCRLRARGGTIELVWPGICGDPELLRAGLDALDGIAHARPSGVYR